MTEADFNKTYLGEGGTIEDYRNVKSIDWQDQIFRTAPIQKYSVNLSGGNRSTRFSTTLSMLDQDGIIKNSNYSRYQGRATIDHRFAKKWHVQAMANYSRILQTGDSPSQTNYTGSANLLPNVWSYRPFVSVGDDDLINEWVDPSINPSQDFRVNPIHIVSDEYRKRINNYFRANAYVEYEIIKDLKVKVMGGFLTDDYSNEQFNGSRSRTGNKYRSDGVNASVQNKSTQQWVNENTLTYKTAFDKNEKHKFDILLGQTMQGSRYRNTYMKATHIPNEHLGINGFGEGSPVVSTYNSAEWTLMSFLSRINYNYDNRYYFTATFRADGSSKFAKNNRWGYFPAASAGWIVDEEAFWPRNKVVSSLKLRASYGLTGNNGIGLYDTYGSYNSAYQYNGMSTTTTGEMPNSNLTWESTTQVNAGLDMGLADDRVRVSFDYYDKVTRNLLFDVTLPNTTGYGSVVSNVGKVRFYGVDLAISSVNISRGDFTWTTDFTYNFNMNKVLKLPDNGNVRNRMDGITIGDGSQFGGIAEGERMGRIFGYVAERIIETQEEADAARYDTQSRGYRRSDRRQIAGRKDIGDYEWVNRAGSTQRDGRDIINEEDQFLLGYATPHSTGGIGNTFRYRNWSLNIYMDYALGHSIQNEMQMRYFMATMGNCNWNLVNDVKQCWSQPGDDTRYARFTANDPDWGNRNFSRMSDVFVEKGDYLCIRDISLSYKLPVRWTSRLGMKDVTLTVSGNTLYYWTAVHGVSPEAATTGGLYNSASTYATGFSPYPPARKILFSAKFTF